MPPSPLAIWWRAGVAGVLLALLLLTKQSTGAGALVGVGAVLMLFPRSAGFRRRFMTTTIVLGCTVIAFSVVALAMRHWVNLPGMFHDVLLTGSQPKGGPLRILRSLIIYAFQIGLGVATLFCLYYVFQSVFNPTPARWNPALAWTRILERPSAPIAETPFLLVALGAFGLGLLAELALVRYGNGLPGQFFEVAWGNILLNLGLIPCLFFFAAFILRRSSDNRASEHPLAVYGVVFLLAAVAHNLSINSWRWSYSNNPLIYLALIFVVGSILSPPPANSQTLAVFFRPLLSALLLAFVILALWPLAGDQIRAVINCRESWPEIKQVTGAKLRPESGGMRELVQTVRSLVNPANSETVLLLPNDPNIEAWFERDRPQLSSAIIFTDQYWDRYVESDLAFLQAHPPKVIIIGPVNFWRGFNQKWNRGAEHLIDLVQERMLTRDYELRAHQPITSAGGTDYMDLYVRREP